MSSEEGSTTLSDIEESIAAMKAAAAAKQGQKRNKHAIPIAIVAGICLLVLIRIILRPKEITREYRKPIPYIFEGSFRRAIEKYVDLPSHSYALAFYGAKGVGVSRGLKTALAEKQRAVINFDPSNLNAEEFVGILMDSVKKGFAGSKEKLLSIPQAQMVSSFFNLTTEISPEKLIQKLLECNTREPETIANAVYDLLISSNAILVLHNPHKILDLDLDESQSRILHQFFRLYKSRKEIAVIIDLSDQRLIESYSKAPVRFFHVSGFDLATARQVLASKNHIFTKNQVSQMFKVFGGHGVYFAAVYELLQSGTPFPVALETVKESADAKTERALKLSKSAAAVAERRALHSELSSKFSVEYHQDKRAARHLLHTGVATLINETHISLASSTLRKK